MQQSVGAELSRSNWLPRGCANKHILLHKKKKHVISLYCYAFQQFIIDVNLQTLSKSKKNPNNNKNSSSLTPVLLTSTWIHAGKFWLFYIICYVMAEYTLSLSSLCRTCKGRHVRQKLLMCYNHFLRYEHLQPATHYYIFSSVSCLEFGMEKMKVMQSNALQWFYNMKVNWMRTAKKDRPVTQLVLRAITYNPINGHSLTDMSVACCLKYFAESLHSTCSWLTLVVNLQILQMRLNPVRQHPAAVWLFRISESSNNQVVCVK